MDLTPKQSTPWRHLLRCCRPPPKQNNDSTGPADGCEPDSDSNGAERKGRRSSNLNSIQEGDDETASASSIHFFDEASETALDLPGADEIGEAAVGAGDVKAGRDDISDVVSMNNESADTSIHMAFWKFLLLMMLRNTLGLDYVSGKMDTITRLLLEDGQFDGKFIEGDETTNSDKEQ